MKREQRLRTNADFQRVRAASGRPASHALLVLYSAPNEQALTRVGITVGRRVGNAVVRNRARRRVSEALRLRWHEMAPGYDVVVVARPGLATASWAAVQQAVDTVARRAGLWRATPRLTPS